MGHSRGTSGVQQLLDDYSSFVTNAVLGSLFARAKPCVVAVLAVRCICMYYMLVRLSVCLNHIKGTIIIIIIIIIIILIECELSTSAPAYLADYTVFGCQL